MVNKIFTENQKTLGTYFFLMGYLCLCFFKRFYCIKPSLLKLSDVGLSVGPNSILIKIVKVGKKSAGPARKLVEDFDTEEESIEDTTSIETSYHTNNNKKSELLQVILFMRQIRNFLLKVSVSIKVFDKDRQ